MQPRVLVPYCQLTNSAEGKVGVLQYKKGPCIEVFTSDGTDNTMDAMKAGSHVQKASRMDCRGFASQARPLQLHEYCWLTLVALLICRDN